MKKSALAIVIAACVVAVSLLLLRQNSNPLTEVLDHIKSDNPTAKRVLFIDSYHESYEPNILARRAFHDGIRSLDVEVNYVFLNAKRDKSATQQKLASAKIKEIYDEWKPDIVVAADDAANKYFVAPYLRDSSVPVVFIGVNWSVSQYGYPFKNVTGQIEIDQVIPLINELTPFAKGSRIGILAVDTLTDRKSIDHYIEKLDLDFHEKILVNTYDEWKSEFVRLQKSVDILILRSNSGITGWDENAAATFVYENVVIPVGTLNLSMAKHSLIAAPKRNNEFGEYAAETVRLILNGASPADIEISYCQSSYVNLNMRLARKLGITFPIQLIQRSHLIGEKKKKLLLLQSYDIGYEWSSRIERSIIRAVGGLIKADKTYDMTESPVHVKFHYMDTKRNKLESFKKQAALKAKSVIEDWKPDVIIAVDDNAAKYLIVPYFMNSSIPIIFCGINWDASIYGFPCDNVTGMEEVVPIVETIDLLKQFAAGSRIGYIGANTLTSKKNVAYYKNRLNLSFTDGALVSDFDEWKKVFERLQKSTDYIVLLSFAGIKDWDENQALDFIYENTTIPIGVTTDSHIQYGLIGNTHVAEEQGWWAGKAALLVLDGVSIADIPVTRNTQTRLLLNMKLAKKLNILFPVELINKATFAKDKESLGVGK